MSRGASLEARGVRPAEKRLSPSAEPHPRRPDRRPDQRRWLALAVVLAAAFLPVLDFFIVNISIPAIQQNLGAGSAHVQWMIAGYGLAYAVFLITGGRLGDIYGRKRMFCAGIASFTFASALCGLARSPHELIGARLLQGIAAAMMFPQVLSIIQVTFDGRERGTAFGLFGVVMGTASFSGNVLGGLLIQANLWGLSWRPVFLVNLPVGLLALAAARPLLHETRSEKAQRLDLPGVLLATAALLLLVFPLVQGREAGWPFWLIGCLLASVPALLLFVRWERHVSERGGSPLVELGLFGDRTFVVGLVTTMIFYGGLSAFFMSFTVFLQEGLRLSPRTAGLTFAPFAIGFFLSSSSAVKLTPRFGSRLIHVGSLFMASALLVVVTLARLQGEALRGVELLPLLLLYGCGQGLVIPTLISIVLSGVPEADAGSASGVVTTIQQVSLALGVAVIGSVFFGVLGPRPHGGDYERAVSTALVGNVCLLALTFRLAFLLPRWAEAMSSHLVEL